MDAMKNEMGGKASVNGVMGSKLDSAQKKSSGMTVKNAMTTANNLPGLDIKMGSGTPSNAGLYTGQDGKPISSSGGQGNYPALYPKV